MTATPLLDEVHRLRRSQGAPWSEADRPVLVADGQVFRIRNLSTVVEADEALVVGVKQPDLEQLSRYLRPRAVMFYEMRVDDLSPLQAMGDLAMLGIHWSTKLASIAPLGELAGLERLSLDDTPKVTDLAPLGRLTRLRALHFSGGIWTKNTANTLDPIRQLGALEELRLANLRVLNGGLRPLAACRALRRLDLSNQFDTADYAYLSVALPETACDHFAPYVPLGEGIGGKDVMVVGARKPFLDSKRDGARLRKYEDEFQRLREEAVADLFRQGER